MTDAKTITGYHAHVYYPDPASRERADVLRESLGRLFEVRLGRWRDEPYGPHPLPFYQVAFAPDQFASLVPWLMLNRDGLTISIHPETGDNVPDHTDNAFWFGEVLALNLDFLRNRERAS